MTRHIDQLFANPDKAKVEGLNQFRTEAAQKLQDIIDRLEEIHVTPDEAKNPLRALK